MKTLQEKKANALAAKKWRDKHPSQASQYRKLWISQNKGYRSPNRQRIREIKESSPCLDCGQYYPAYVMHFDHREPLEKKMEVANLVNSSKWDVVAVEIAKCDLVCANCHAYRTHDRIIYKHYVQEVS